MNVELNLTEGLPSSWIALKLGYLRQLRSKTFNPGDNPKTTLELYSVPSLETGRPEVIVASDIGSNKQYVKPGDVLISKINPRLNRTWVVGDFTKYQKIASTEWIVFPKSDFVESTFLRHVLGTFKVRDFLAHNASGVGGSLTRAKPALLDTISIGLPPLTEQRRIVSKLEELFSKIEKGIESLESAREQLNTYRHAVLKHAFEGKLTDKWRQEKKESLKTSCELLAQINQEQKSRYEEHTTEWKAAVNLWEEEGKQGKKPKKPKKPDPLSHLGDSQAEDLPILPKGWFWVPLSWLLSLSEKPMTTGPFGTMLKKHEHKETGIPVLGIENIGSGKFVPGNKIFITKSKASELAAFEVRPKDIVISRSGTVGEICEVPDNLGTALISTNLIRVSLNLGVVSSPFFVLMFQGGTVKSQVNELCKGSSRAFLNQTILKSLVFPLCGIDEQIAVTREVDEKLSQTKKMLEEVSECLKRLNALRQSILIQAFSGNLLDQDPNDEPASELLARIKLEKDARDEVSKKSSRAHKKKLKKKDTA